MSYSFWDYEYIPEISKVQVPREQQENAYKAWDKDKDKTSMNTLVRTFGKLINSEISRYQGTLQRPLLLSFAKKYVIDAVKSYKPESGNQLSTHIVNQLQRLHRINYSNVQALKSSEEVQRKMNTFFQTKMDLENELGREPNTIEVANKMKVSPSFINKMTQQIKLEREPSEFGYAAPLVQQNLEEQEVADMVYYELPDIHKKIFEYKTGYGGTSIISNKEIAKKLKLSPVRVTQIGLNIANKLKKQFGQL